MKASNETPFYLDRAKVQTYIEMREGINGGYLVDHLAQIVKPDSSVLELGMGPGTDLILLDKLFRVTGSDYSSHFVELFKERYPAIRLEVLDAITLKTRSRFDCVFSNKVLHHFSETDLQSSLERQVMVVKNKGLLFHSFWIGHGSERCEDLFFKKYMPDYMIRYMEQFGEVVDHGLYRELITNDSFYVAVRTS